MRSVGCAGRASRRWLGTSARSAPAAAVVVGKDVVRLKNGGLLRGTITELLPGDSVTIVTSSGKARELPMAEVEYAGPADRDPAAAPAPPAAVAPAPPAVAPTLADAAPPASDSAKPYVTVESDRASVRFESEPPGITFHRAATSAVAVGPGGAAIATGYERLCTAPCSVTMPAGTETLALSPAGGGFARSAGPVTIPPGSSRITGSFESRAGLRTAGWVLLLGSVVGGGLMIYASFDKEEECTGNGDFRSCDDRPVVNVPLLALGLGAFAVGMPVSLVLTAQPDKPVIRVGSNPPSSLAPLRGVALKARF